MNMESKAFGLHVSPLYFGEELEITGTNVVGEYESKIWTINLNISVPSIEKD